MQRPYAVASIRGDWIAEASAERSNGIGSNAQDSPDECPYRVIPCHNTFGASGPFTAARASVPKYRRWDPSRYAGSNHSHSKFHLHS